MPAQAGISQKSLGHRRGFFLQFEYIVNKSMKLEKKHEKIPVARNGLDCCRLFGGL